METEVLSNYTKYGNSHRLTQKQKDADDKEWYKKQIDKFAARAFSSMMGFGEISEFTRKKVNYDLFNNIIDVKDFTYVCQPYGAEVGEMPAKMVNRDILSNKIKLLIGMEMQRPFGWKLVATDEDATTRKEQEKTKRLQEYVVSEIMTPIQQEIELKYQEQTKGRKLTPDEQNQIQQQIQQEIAAQTPPEVDKYMNRQHQDPSEILGNQILQYLTHAEQIPFKFNTGWKHANLAGEEFYWTGIINDKPVLRVVNPLFFDYERTHENFFVEDGSWAIYDLRLTPDEVVKWFADELSDEEIDMIYNEYPYGQPQSISSTDFNVMGYPQDSFTMRVLHVEFKSLRLIQYLTYFSQATGEIEEMIVSEDYRLNKEAGDIKLRKEWIPELHEGYKIGADLYKSCRPVIGQHKDITNLYHCKLRYHGTAYDALNSMVTAPMDRGKPYQYFYNIILYRIEMLMASDKGRWLLMNINMIPKSAGIDIKKWLYYTDALKIGFFNPSEEGNKGTNGNVGEAAKEVDMSLISDIQKYIVLADKIEEKLGAALGITRQMEGQLGPTDAVTNTKQSILQSSFVLEPLFDLHNVVKRNVLQSLIEQAKIAYTMNPPESLNYMMDDMSLAMINLNRENLDLLENSTYGLFVSNSSQSFKAKQLIEELAKVAVEHTNVQVDLSDVIKIVRSENVQEAEEMLETAEARKRKETVQQQQSEQQSQAQEAEKQREFLRETWQHEQDMIILKEQERRKTVLQSDTIKATGFDENKDENNNGQPDVLDLEEHFLNVKATNDKTQLERDKLDHKKKDDAIKNKLAEQKLQIDRKKANKQSTS